MEAREVLMKALRLERDGKEAYTQAAARARDPETAEMFRTLAEDEQNHHDYIQRQLDALQAGQAWVPIPELAGIEPVDKEGPIFPAGKKALDELPADASDEDALLFGLNAEVKSHELYRQSAEQTDNQDGRRMFEALAAVEQKHFDLLMMRYESLFGYPR